MTQTSRRSPGGQQSANEIFARAAEERVEQQRLSAENAKKHAPIKRQSVVLLLLLVSASVLSAVFAINVLGVSVGSLFETPPTPAAARDDVQRTLETLVADIDLFRKNYNELPESLVEIGVPPRGTWKYTVTGALYRVEGTYYGQKVSFDSASAGLRIAKEQQ